MLFKTVLIFLVAFLGIVYGDGWHGTCPTPKTVQKLNFYDMSGEWFVYQRTQTRDNINKECNHLSLKYNSDSSMTANYTVYNTATKALETKTFGMTYDNNYPGIILADDYTGQSNDSPNLTFHVLDFNPDLYVLLFLCELKYDGARTEESAYLLFRSLKQPNATLIGALDGVLQSANYTGQPLMLVNHAGSCQGL